MTRKAKGRRELREPIKETAMQAIERAIEPLMDLALDAGITVPEFHTIIKDSGVRIASNRLINREGRSSKSRVAIVTGLSRAEVKAISSRNLGIRKPSLDHPVNRILAAWHEDRIFQDQTGDPAVLPLYGQRRSFEHLVRKHSGGIPMRAMLDELVHLDVIEISDQQSVKVTAMAPRRTTLNQTDISALGQHGAELFSTLMHNARRPIERLFEGTAFLVETDADAATSAMQELSQFAKDLLDASNCAIEARHKASDKSPPRGREKFRVGITAYCFQTDPPTRRGPALSQIGRRKNFKRRKPN